MVHKNYANSFCALNILGQVVVTLVNGKKDQGRHEIKFDESFAFAGLPSGTYFFRLRVNTIND